MISINDIYYGCETLPSSYSEAFIKSLTNKKKLPGLQTDISALLESNKYVFICMPVRFGEPSFWYNNFCGGFTLASNESYQVTNENNLTEAYNIYRSDYILYNNKNNFINITIK